MDTAQWPQEIVVKPIEEIIVGNKASLERRVRPQKEQALNCPRCNSTNTKFCYYNNYSLSQPRYFCKTCRRYWTEGGTLRSIPVGGGSRKNKRSSQSNSSSSSTSPLPNSSKSIKFPDLVHSSQNPKIIHDHDLNLGFPSTSDFKTISDLIQVPNFDGEDNNHNMGSNSATNSSHSLSALELFNGITTSRGFNSFMPVPMADPESVYSSGFSVPEFKPSLGFSLDGIGNSGYGSLQETSGRLLFPFEDLKVQVSSTTTDADQNRENGDSTGYWNGMLGGGSW